MKSKVEVLYKKLMRMKGIITADVVGSTKMDPKLRNALPETLSKLAKELQVVCPIQYDMYRGDSFQVLVEDYTKAPLVAVLFRLGLMRSCPDEKNKIDARMAIGIGGVSFIADTLGKSDGEAFVLSGHAFDRLEKKRLVVSTPSPSLNDELTVYIAILDELLTDVSVARSKTIFAHLANPELKQEKIGNMVGITKQAVGQAYRASKVSIMDLVLERIEIVLANNLKK